MTVGRASVGTDTVRHREITRYGSRPSPGRRQSSWRKRRYPSIFAGRSSTDSPQPQAETWLGLLKTNWACILSAL